VAARRAFDAGRAIALALAEHAHAGAEFGDSPQLVDSHVRVLLHDHRAARVHVVGSWDGWRRPGTAARRLDDGTWEARVDAVPPGRHAYKLVVDDAAWMADPRTPVRSPDGFGAWNSVLVVPYDAPALTRGTDGALPAFQPPPCGAIHDGPPRPIPPRRTVP
jgi:hypothetical protein